MDRPTAVALRGMRSPVSGVTGLWALLLGWFFFAGMIVWFVKVNGALNEYWRSQGAAWSQPQGLGAGPRRRRVADHDAGARRPTRLS